MVDVLTFTFAQDNLTNKNLEDYDRHDSKEILKYSQTQLTAAIAVCKSTEKAIEQIRTKPEKTIQIMYGLIHALGKYVGWHEAKALDVIKIEERRKDDWDILAKKCKEDPMFKDLWDELMLLLKLEQD